MLFFDRICSPSTEPASLSLLENSTLSGQAKRKEGIPGVQEVIWTAAPEFPSQRMGSQGEQRGNQMTSKHHLTLTMAISFVKSRKGRQEGTSDAAVFLFSLGSFKSQSPELINLNTLRKKKQKTKAREFPNDCQTLKALTARGVYFSPKQLLSMERSSPGGNWKQRHKSRNPGRGFLFRVGCRFSD